jgi:hypothetical protein
MMRDEVLSRMKKSFLTAFSDRNPITAGNERLFQKLIPGAQSREHPTNEACWTLSAGGQGRGASTGHFRLHSRKFLTMEPKILRSEYLTKRSA